MWNIPQSRWQLALASTVCIGGLLCCASPAFSMDPAPTTASLTTCNITETKTIKIGLLAPFSGPFAADAGDFANAATMAAEELNAAGGVCGKEARYKFDLVKADTESQRSDAVVTGFRRLNAEDGLNFIMAPYASTSNFEIDLMAQAKMPYLLSANAEQTKAMISKKPDAYSTVWSRVPSYLGYNTDLPPLLDKLMAEHLLTLPEKSVYIIGSDDPYGATIAEGLTATFQSDGWKLVGKEKVPFQSVTDWRTQLARIREAKPGVIVLTESSPPSDAAFFNQFIEQPTSSVVFLQYGPSVPEFSKLTHGKSTGVLYNLVGASIGSRPDTKEISAKYEKRFGVGGYFSVAGYNDLFLYALCIQKGVDPSDRVAIGKCLGSLDVDTPAGHMVFDQTTHLAKGGDQYLPTLFYQLNEKGVGEIISPPNVAEARFKQPYWMTK